MFCSCTALKLWYGSMPPLKLWYSGVPMLKLWHSKPNIHSSLFFLLRSILFIYIPNLNLMKKSLLLGLLLSAAAGGAFAQSSPTSVSFNKISQPGLMLELPYEEEICGEFIVANLKKTGYDAETKGKLFWKQNKQNGFYTFKDVQLQGVKKQLDLYIKVEQKGARSAAETVIYLLVGKDEQNFVSSRTDEEAYKAARNFLDGFISESASYKRKRDIEEQETKLASAQKKLEKLETGGRDLLKKLEQLQKEIAQNTEEQNAQRAQAQTEKRKLEILKNEDLQASNL